MLSNPFLQAIQDAGGIVLSSQHSTRKQAPDTIEDAREKAIKLVRENKNWFQFKLGQEPSLIYKPTGKTYWVGIKYANRFLKGWCEDQFDGYEEVLPQQMLQYFDALIWDIENGNVDAALKVVMEDVMRMRASKKTQASPDPEQAMTA